MGRRLDRDEGRIAAILAHYEQSQNLGTTGEAFGISRERTRQILAREGVNTKRKPKPKEPRKPPGPKPTEDRTLVMVHRNVTIRTSDDDFLLALGGKNLSRGIRRAVDLLRERGVEVAA